jgi:hypothetical protein
VLGWDSAAFNPTAKPPGAIVADTLVEVLVTLDEGVLDAVVEIRPVAFQTVM